MAHKRAHEQTSTQVFRESLGMIKRLGNYSLKQFRTLGKNPTASFPAESIIMPQRHTKGLLVTYLRKKVSTSVKQLILNTNDTWIVGTSLNPNKTTRKHHQQLSYLALTSKIKLLANGFRIHYQVTWGPTWTVCCRG